MKSRILFLVPATYDALVVKGVDRMIRERDEDGFFERVVTVHPLAERTRTIHLDAVHCIYELGIGSGAGAAWRTLAAFRDIVRIARAERVDLVRANDPYLMGLIGCRVARVLGVPLCVSVHTDYRSVFALNPQNLGGRLRRLAAGVLPGFVLPRADMVMPIREQMVPALRAAGASQDRIRLIPHGIDLQPFDAPPAVDIRHLLRIPEDRRVVSVACRLSPENYIADLATVIERVTALRTDVTFVVFGDGPDAPILTRLAGGDRSGEAIRLLPFQPSSHVIALRRASDVSLCLMGGFSLIEACAAGSPSIAYDVAWHRELIRDGETGCLVDEHDIDGVVRAIDRLLDNRALASAMGARARQLARERHDRRATSAIKRSLYTELLGAGRARRP